MVRRKEKAKTFKHRLITNSQKLRILILDKKYLTQLIFFVMVIGLMGCSSQVELSNTSGYERDLEQLVTTSANNSYSVCDHVYPLLDSNNSRWFYFASTTRPFGMVSLIPDTQIGGAWGSGYRYMTDTIKGLSHIHAWQLSGVSVMPVAFEENSVSVFDDYYSPFDHDEEVVEVGYHKVNLQRYDIDVELSSTERVGFHKYTYRKNSAKGIRVQTEGLLGPASVKNGSLTKVDDYTIHGEVTNSPTRRRPKDITIHFVIRLDQTIDKIDEGDEASLILLKEGSEQVKMKVGISYTSIENAVNNLESEIPHWDFEQVVSDTKEKWEDMLGRIKIKHKDSIQVRRFYTDLWHSLHGRKLISDVNGAYPDHTGESFKVGQLPLGEDGKPTHNHYNSDSFWGAQWTLNTLWGLVYPDIYNDFVNSLLLYYKDGGMIPRGPSGGNYTYVMTGASSTPFIVSAYQKGIRDYDIQLAYEGLIKNHMMDGIMTKAGYEHKTKLGGGLSYYIENGYVPHPIPEGKFGYHQDGASLTMEYAYQDWALAQMAKSLGKNTDYTEFKRRSKNYVNVFDKSSNWMRPKNVEGKWKEPFDPYQYENGFNESNAAQSTWFVPHDLKGLADLMGGREVAIAKLNEQFEVAEKLNFTSGDSHQKGEDPTRARVPINYGNQPSIQTAYIFSHLGRPDLTQEWTAKIREKTFGGLATNTGYSGDEDQGLMGSLAVLMKLGIFQMTGGVEEDPIYELTVPLFDEINIELQNGNNLNFSKKGNGQYINKVELNGVEETIFSITHSKIMKGGDLVFYLRD